MKRSRRKSIRGKLIRSTLPLVLVPIVGLGTVAIVSINSLREDAATTIDATEQRLGQDVIGPKVQAVADQISRELGYFLEERVQDASAWATSPLLVQRADEATLRFEESGLLNRSTTELEAAFTDGTLRSEVLVVDESDPFAEIFFTDRNGLTVASSTATSDFVQSDEEWWAQAWERGIHVSAVERDESAGVVSVDVSLRIDTPDGRPVGVLKTVLDVASVQSVADRFSGGANQYDITITDQRGLLLAETASGHDSDRLLNPSMSARESTNPRVARALSSAGSIFTIDEEAVAGYGHANRVIAADRDLSSDALARSLKLAFDWRVVVEQPVAVAFAPLQSLGQIDQDLGQSSQWLSRALIGMVLGAAALALAIIWFLSRRITRPIELLSERATHVATTDLPEIVERIDQLGEDDAIPELAPLAVKTNDEVEQLCTAFNAMQETATRLAAEQAQMRRRNVAKTFVSLGRRNQNLLTRQLEQIDEMQRSETDPETLRQLFGLDHLVTRMRRNAESLLVLAGEDAPRRFRRPVSIHDVIQAAGAETEDFKRMDIVRIDNAAIDGASASAVAHLLAEMLENAGRFSAPTTRIQVEGRLREHGFTVSIMDQGIGLTPTELAEANERLANPTEFDRAPSAYLGLFVVGHLARRHGITVRLSHSPFDGIVAKVDVPAVILVDPALLDDAPTQPEPMPTFTPVPIQLQAPMSVPIVRPPEHRMAHPEAQHLGQSGIGASGIGPTGIESVEHLASASAQAVEPPETTPSGFRRRRRGFEGAPVGGNVVAEPVGEPIDRQPRDPQAVGAFLSNFRSGVHHGRMQVSASESFELEMSPPATPEGGTPHA